MRGECTGKGAVLPGFNAQRRTQLPMRPDVRGGSWCCTAVAAADVGCAVIGMKRLCLDPTVLGDCWGGSVSICLTHFSYYIITIMGRFIRDITNCGQTLEI